MVGSNENKIALSRVSLETPYRIFLSNINFDILSNSVTVLSGSNGAGKTILADLICGLVTPTAGSIKINFEDITKMPAHKRSKKYISRMYQQNRLFGRLTVKQNLEQFIGNKLQFETNAALVSYLDKLGIFSFFNKYPNEISYGQCRIVYLICCLFSKKMFSIFDEPLAGLSPKTAIDVGELFVHMKKHQGILIIEHRLAPLERIADRKYLLDKGNLYFQNTNDDKHNKICY